MRLLEPYQLGPLTLKNRVVMAPMTRSRAPEHVAGDLTPPTTRSARLPA